MKKNIHLNYKILLIVVLLFIIYSNWNKIIETFYANTPFVWMNPVKSVYLNPLLYHEDDIYNYYIIDNPAKGPAVLSTGFIPNPYYHRHTQCNCGNNK